jgi:hypothetical protein
MRRADQRLSGWLLQLPLWRYLLIYFAMWLPLSYAVTSAANWTSNHWFGADGRADGGAPLSLHLFFAAAMTGVPALARPHWRRLHAQRAERRQRVPVRTHRQPASRVEAPAIRMSRDGQRA